MERYQALWEKELVQDESVVFVERNGIIYGNLAFEPQEILQAKDRNGRLLLQGIDFEVEGQKVILKNRAIYFFKEEWLRNENVPDIPNENKRYGIHGALLIDPLYLRERQILISYKKEKCDCLRFLPESITLPKTLEKLRVGKRLKIALFGDSISNAANSSWEMGLTGYEHYFSKVCRIVGELYDASVSYINVSRSGYGTEWALSAVEEKLKESNADLVVIAFGMNDAPDGISTEKFTRNVAELMCRIAVFLPDAEYVLVAPPLPNSDCKWVYAGQDDYYNGLKELNTTGACALNFTLLSQFLLKNKAFVEISGNNLNHPNDFFYEWYADAYITLFDELRREIN